MQQRRADAAAAHGRIHEDHGDPGEVRRIPQGGHRADDSAGLVERDGGAARRGPQELLPVAGQLIPVARPTQAQACVDIGFRHRAQHHVMGPVRPSSTAGMAVSDIPRQGSHAAPRPSQTLDYRA